MKMKGYLIDTHILIWALTDNCRLNKNVKEDIEYFQYAYYASVESLREIVMLRNLKKIDVDLNMAISYLQQFQIQIVPIELEHVQVLEKLPTLTINGKIHPDPFDRMLIAQSIAEEMTIISADAKFPFYRDYGLKLLINE